MSSVVFAISEATTNASIIEDCRTLGYLKDEWDILDPTYGLGRFWTSWRPRHLTACDLDPKRSPIGYSVDFRAMEFQSDEFDAVVFDPPYKYVGTSAHASDGDYGVAVQGVSWQDRNQLINDGITESFRVLKPDGYLLVKCQDQVVSGKVRWQTRLFADHAESLGCRLVDMLHLMGHRPQPEGRRRVHSRRNYSTLLILKAERKQSSAQLSIGTQADYELSG